MGDPLKSFRVGLTGTGRINGICLRNCAEFAGLDIVACGSLDVGESTVKAV